MLTSNIDVSDKLINGQMGNVIFIEWENSKVKTVYVNFDDVNAGKNKKLLDPLARRHDAVPIQCITSNIKLRERIEASPIIKRT